MTVVAILIAKMLDPIMILLAIIAALFCRSWLQVLIAAVVIATILEVLLLSMNPARSMIAERWLIGVVASGIWVSLAYAISSRWRAKPTDAK